MYQSDDFSWDDLDGGFYESMSRSTGHTERWLDGDGNKQSRTRAVFSPEDGDDHHIFNSDLGFGDDGLSPVRMLSGHDPDDYTSLTDQYIDLGDGEVLWSHGIFQTDDQDARELRDDSWEWDDDKSKWVDATGNGRKGSYNTGEQERRDIDLLLDPGSRKIRDRQRVHREGHGYNDRKLVEQWKRDAIEAGEYPLDEEGVQDLYTQVEIRREKSDFQLWLEECGGKNGKRVGERQARRIRLEIEDLGDEQRDENETVIRYRDDRQGGWISGRERAQLESTGRWPADPSLAGQQYDPTSDHYSRQQMASIAAQLDKHDGDVTKVIVPPERFERVSLETKARQSEEIARLTDEYKQRGGEIETVPPMEDSWTPEFRRKMKYRWLRWNRW